MKQEGLVGRVHRQPLVVRDVGRNDDLGGRSVVQYRMDGVASLDAGLNHSFPSDTDGNHTDRMYIVTDGQSVSDFPNTVTNFSY